MYTVLHTFSRPIIRFIAMQFQNTHSDVFCFIEEERLTYLDCIILDCIFDANITPGQWDSIKEHMGIATVMNVLEFCPEDIQAVDAFESLLNRCS